MEEDLRVDGGLAHRKRGPRGRPASNQLSSVQYEIIFLAQEGLTITKIAERLGRSPRTIAHHLATIYEKLDIKNKSELLRHEL